MKISLCMIVRDEEEVLERCLKSAAPLVDEIVIADTGSKDGTREIARSFTDNVYSFEWIDDFAAARNFSFSKATGDYLLWLDADDVIPAHSQALFPALKETLETQSPDLVMCPYDVAFDANGAPLSTFFRERFFKAAAHFAWKGRVHECIAPQGEVVRSDFRVQHLGSSKVRGARNLHIYQKWAKEEPLSERDKYYYGRELFYNGLYIEAVAVLEEMLRGNGWYVNKIDACKTLAQCRAARGEREKAREALFKSFEYGEPRASVLCMIGSLFRAEKRFREAAVWYEWALLCRDHAADGDFEEPACRALNPLLELVCCHYALGDMEKAEFYHKKTEELAPEHPSVTYNRRFFNSRA